MKKIVLVVALTTLVGCASSGVVPIGQDTYMVSKNGAAGFSSSGSLKAELFQEAAAYCVSQKKIFQVVNTSGNAGGFGHTPEAEVQFMCLNQDDAELVRPKLRKEADTVIETRRN
jgi:hypothetical protein